MHTTFTRFLLLFGLVGLTAPALAGFTHHSNRNATTPQESQDAGACRCSAKHTPDGGMPVYAFTSMLASLHLHDTPLRYTPPVGASMAFTLYYNSRQAEQAPSFQAVNLGHNWTLNWISYITDDPAAPGHKVSLFTDGGTRTFSGYDAATGRFTPQEHRAAVLVRVADQPITYELHHADGSKDVFAAPDGHSGSPRRVYLTQRVDPQGNAVTLHYNKAMQLTSVTDAIGQTTSFQYDNPDHPKAITGITGPFGRQVSLGYDSQGRLDSSTDVIGMTSTFAYQGSGHFISSMTTPYGTTTFKQTRGQHGSLSASIQATDPLGYTSRTEFRHNAPGIAFSAPRVPAGMGARNQYLNYRNSFYWDKSAFAKACTTSSSGEVSCDYTKARLKHFLHNSHSSSETSRVLESIKNSQENRVWYRYPGQSNTLDTGSLDRPSIVGRVLSNGDTQLTQYRYNTQGKITQRIDPNGRETDFTYAANGLDLIKVQQRTANGLVTLAKYTWNQQHKPLTHTDAAGKTTSYTYNARGQRTSATNALGQTSTYSYNGDGYLTTVTNAQGHTQRSLTYDDKGRIATDTDSQGHTLTYQYDALNRITQIGYPDGTHKTFTWNKLDLASITDREGHTTTYTYDADRHLTSKTDAMGQVTTYTWYPNGLLKSLTDPNGHTTTWQRDLEGRVTAKTYDDGQGSRFDYGLAGRLISKTDALGQITHYQYTTTGKLTGVNYTHAVNPTPSVSLTYGAHFPRLMQMVDGHGTTDYHYYPAGVLGATRVKAIQGPNAHDSLQYQYDALNRLASRTVDGDTETYTYDALGRLKGDHNALGDITNQYLGDTAQITQQQAADSPYQVGYQYASNRNDRRLKAIRNQTVKVETPSLPWPFNTPQWSWLPKPPSHTVTTPVSNFQFTTNADGLITDRTSSGWLPSSHHHHYHGGGHSGWHGGLWGWLFGFGHHWHHGRSWHHGHQQQHNGSSHYHYDADHRLLGAEGIVPAAYQYDPAGNLVEKRLNGQPTQMTANGLNQPVSVNQTTLQYDADGNLLKDGKRHYQWDAANRLLSITDTATGKVTTFAYDGFSRRISKTVTDQSGNTPTTTTTHNLWCGQRLCEQRDNNGSAIARYFSQGEIQNGKPYFYAQDQVGSVVAMVSPDGTVKGRTQYGPYGQIISKTGIQPHYAYAGLYHDTTNDLYLATWRAYDPQIGHWLKRDPIREAGGLNLYAYVGGEPVNLIDHNGELFGLPAGESYGVGVAQYWANKQVQTGNPFYAVPGALASLWTPCTSDATVTTLLGGGGAGSTLIGRLGTAKVLGSIGTVGFGVQAYNRPTSLNLMKLALDVVTGGVGDSTLKDEVNLFSQIVVSFLQASSAVVSTAGN